MSKISNTKVWVQCISAWMVLNPSDFVDRHIFIEGEYERSNLDIIKSICGCGSTVVDVGANIGWFTLATSHFVGPNGNVIAFEPAPGIFRRLTTNIELNRGSNSGRMAAYNLGLSDCPGKVAFLESTEGNSGLSSMRPGHAIQHTHTSIPVIHLDSMLDTIPEVTLIKMDIEGAEMKAFAGMKELIKRDHPVLLLELTDSFLREMGSSASELCQNIAAFGYDIFRRDTNSELRAISDPPLEQCDVLCLHKDFHQQHYDSLVANT